MPNPWPRRLVDRRVVGRAAHGELQLDGEAAEVAGQRPGEGGAALRCYLASISPLSCCYSAPLITASRGSCRAAPRRRRRSARGRTGPRPRPAPPCHTRGRAHLGARPRVAREHAVLHEPLLARRGDVAGEAVVPDGEREAHPPAAVPARVRDDVRRGRVVAAQRRADRGEVRAERVDPRLPGALLVPPADVERDARRAPPRVARAVARPAPQRRRRAEHRGGELRAVPEPAPRGDGAAERGRERPRALRVPRREREGVPRGDAEHAGPPARRAPGGGGRRRPVDRLLPRVVARGAPPDVEVAAQRPRAAARGGGEEPPAAGDERPPRPHRGVQRAPRRVRLRAESAQVPPQTTRRAAPKRRAAVVTPATPATLWDRGRGSRLAAARRVFGKTPHFAPIPAACVLAASPWGALSVLPLLVARRPYARTLGRSLRTSSPRGALSVRPHPGALSPYVLTPGRSL
eukprot:gene909-biopygen1362